MLSKGNQLRAAANAPAVALGFALIAYVIVRTGCSAPFVDTDFFGVPVTVFLLLALTVTALILIVFAGLNAWRAYRVLRRRRRGGDDLSARRRIGIAAVSLSVAAFMATAWLGAVFLMTPCL